MISCSHWGVFGDLAAEPMECHGQPVFGDVLWWVTDDKTASGCAARFPNKTNWWAGSAAYQHLNFGPYLS